MPKPPRLAFVVSAPRSGSTMLERMLEAHSQVLGGPEPHLMTPLAHLGMWHSVERAPYDIAGASAALRALVERLPNGEDDYYRAIREYCDVLYGRWHATRPDARLCLDKTPAYGLVLPFLKCVYPDAAYIVLTRHPLATFASYANSFFNGDYAAAQAYNPVLERYVPALAAFLRQQGADCLHVRYEDLVTAPETGMQGVCEYLGLPFEPGMLAYGGKDAARPGGLGDPIGVARHERPVTDSIEKWPADLLRKPEALRLMEAVMERLDPDDLDTLGYPAATLWAPLESARGRPLPPPAPAGPFRYRLQRAAILRLRAALRGTRPLRAAVAGVRRACSAVLPGA